MSFPKRNNSDQSLLDHIPPERKLVPQASKKTKTTSLRKVQTNDTDSTNIDLDALQLDEDEDQLYDNDSFAYSNDEALKGYNDFSNENTNSSGNVDNYIFRKTGTLGTALSSLDFLPVASQSNFGNNNVSGDMPDDTLDQAQEVEEDDDDDEDYDDIEAFTYQHERKLNDKFKSTSQLVDEQDKLYASLNILDDVKKLKDTKLFNKKYTENLRTLKEAQLNLLVDLVQMNENSFEEFYDIWHTQEEVDLESVRKKKPRSNLPGDFEQNFDINKSDMFSYINEKTDLIIDELANIKESALNIDSYTKSLWDQL